MEKQAEMQDRGIDEQGGTSMSTCEGETATEADVDESSFKGTFRRSITPVLSLIEDLIGRFVWAGHRISLYVRVYHWRKVATGCRKI